MPENVTVNGIAYNFYGERVYVGTRLDIPATGAIEFGHAAAPGGGSLYQITRTGMTFINDGGAARQHLEFNSTQDTLELGCGLGVGGQVFLSPNMGGYASMFGGACGIETISDEIICFFNGFGAANQLLFARDGYWLEYGISFTDEFNKVSWGAGGTVGADWRSSITAGAITLVTPARGGIVAVNATGATPTFLDQNNIRTISLQDQPRILMRWRSIEVANTHKAIGLADTINGAGPTPYTDDGLYLELNTANAQPNYYLVGVRATARVAIDSTIAFNAEHHIMELRTIDDGVTWNLYIAGTLRATIPAANAPVTTTMLQRIIYSGNLGGAVQSNNLVDFYKMGMMRYTGAGDT